MRSRGMIPVLMVLVTLCAPVSKVQAVDINYSTGFESAQGFPLNAAVPSPNASLSGWVRFDEIAASGPLPSITIGSINHGGTQGLTIQTIGFGDGNDFSSAVSPVAGLTGATDVVANGTPHIRIKWDMRVDDQALVANNSINWGLDVFGAMPADPQLAPPLLVNVSRSVDATLGPIILGTDSINDVGFFVPLSLSAPDSVAWATYQIDLDYTNYTYQFSLDGVAMGGTHSFLAVDNGLDVGLTVSARGVDVGYFDNFSVSSVPEPSGLVLVLAASMLLKRRIA